MVRHFEQIDIDWPEFALSGLFDIAAEEHRVSVPAHYEYQGSIVDFVVTTFRADHLDSVAADLEGAPDPGNRQRGALSPKFFGQLIPYRRGLIAGCVPHGSDPDPTRQTDQAADVIEVGVSSDDQVDMSHSVPIERLPKQPRVATTIDEYHCSGGVKEQSGVALTDIYEYHTWGGSRRGQQNHQDDPTDPGNRQWTHRGHQNRNRDQSGEQGHRGRADLWKPGPGLRHLQNRLGT